MVDDMLTDSRAVCSRKEHALFCVKTLGSEFCRGKTCCFVRQISSVCFDSHSERDTGV